MQRRRALQGIMSMCHGVCISGRIAMRRTLHLAYYGCNVNGEGISDRYELRRALKKPCHGRVIFFLPVHTWISGMGVGVGGTCK